MLCVPLDMGMSAAHCQGIVREFHSVWRVVTLSEVAMVAVTDGDNLYV